MSSDVRVDCIPDALGWLCSVDTGSTQHRVIVTQADLDELAPGASDPTGLVGESFAFLLEREPKESILRRFELSEIGRYFPGWERDVRASLGAAPERRIGQ